MMGTFLNENGLLGTGVEVGVNSGGNARQIMSLWKGHRIWLVDTWGTHNPKNYLERTDWCDFDGAYRECQEFAKKDNRVRLLKMSSVEAVTQFDDGSLDWVYIDGSHALHDAAMDFHIWFTKLKSGGLFGAHDCYWQITETAFCEVQFAVEAMALRLKQPIHKTECTSAWFYKP